MEGMTDKVVQVAVGAMHCLALTEKGEVSIFRVFAFFLFKSSSILLGRHLAIIEYLYSFGKFLF